MKIFFSWSGSASHRIAVILRDWLPNVLQTAVPYVSSKDIQKGERWFTDISGELETSEYGIICVSPSNLTAPWIFFEAGALAKSQGLGKVCPLLWNVSKSALQGPLAQFQAAIFEKDEIEQLVLSINKAQKSGQLDETRVRKVFNKWWPELLESVEQLPEEEDFKASHVKRDASAIVEEILELTRGIARRQEKEEILREKAELAERAYLESYGRNIGWRTYLDPYLETSGKAFLNTSVVGGSVANATITPAQQNAAVVIGSKLVEALSPGAKPGETIVKKKER